VNEYHLDGYDIIERYVVVFIGRYSIVKSGNTTIKKKIDERFFGAVMGYHGTSIFTTNHQLVLNFGMELH